MLKKFEKYSKKKKSIDKGTVFLSFPVVILGKVPECFLIESKSLFNTIEN